MAVSNTFTLVSFSILASILIFGCIHRGYEHFATRRSYSPAARFIVHERDAFILFSVLNLTYCLGQVQLLYHHVLHSTPLNYFTALFLVGCFPLTLLGSVFDGLVVLKTCSPDFATTRSIIALKRKNEAVFKTRSSLKYTSIVFGVVASMLFHAVSLQQGQAYSDKVAVEIYHIYSVMCYALVILMLVVYTHVGAWEGLEAVENHLSDVEIDQAQARMLVARAAYAAR